MLWLLTGAALALPQPILGTSGPAWVGPLPPEDGRSLVAVVDPDSGALVVEVTERDGRLRTWEGTQWAVDGALIDPEEPAVGHRMDGAQLRSATASLGASHEFGYDDDGRLDAVVWANGERMGVRYDDAGRVIELSGPGQRQLSLSWGTGLSWTDEMGRSSTLRTQDAGPMRTVTLTDPVGRTVATQYRQRDGEWTLTGWVDPRGLETRVGTYGGRMDVTAPGGRVYRLEVKVDGTVRSVTMPAGHRWIWERGAEGEVQRIVDPAGRVTRWERDKAGRVVTVSPSGRVMRVGRDAAGRITSIKGPTGAVTQLVRDGDGVIRSVVDPLGNTAFIERFENGWPSAVLDRNGVRWTFGQDTLGLIDRVTDPAGDVVQLHRDGAGWLERIEHGELGTVRLGRDNAGRLVSVTDVDGQTTQFSWDATGWLSAIERADGETLSLERNPVGELIAFRFRDQLWRIERAPDGQPRRLGEVQWSRDINGDVRAVKSPLGEWQLTRDPAGWVRSIQSGDWLVEIERDASGWPVAWRGTDGDIAIQRDAAGRVVTEAGGPVETRVLRDPRGLPVRIVAGKLGEWRTQRDASGRVLTVRGPEGVTLGVERDPVGRPKWFRFPDGTMLRRSTTPTRTEDLLVGPSGQAMGTGAVTRTVDGAVRERIGPDGFVWRYDRNGAGDLLSISAEPDQMWSFDPGRVLTPDGRLQLYSVDEWLMESQLADGPAAWGLATGIVSMIRSDSGRLEAVTGDAGVSPVRFDALGRMVSFRAPDGVGWSVRYDARGRPTAVNDGDVDALWLWAPDADPAGGVSGLLASGVEAAVPWVFSEGGMAVRRNAMNIEGIVADGRGDPAWMLDGEGGVAVLSHSPSGLPRQMATDIVGAGGRLQWFPGGPIQVGPVAIDPVSGQRADGVKAWPWAPKGPREVALNHPADPAPWAPVSVWGKPLRILEAMGVLKPVTDGDWVELNAPPTAHSSLPASLDRSDVPLGPALESVPMTETDPVTWAVIQACLPGRDAEALFSPAAALIGSELDLPWLPPGWVVPGLETWRDAGAWEVD